nr:hypothetical protein [Tanacetum cinerariifolium]
MMVTAQEEVGKGSDEVHSPSSEIPIEESISTPSNNPLHSGEDSIQLNELMIFYTNLQQQEKDSLGAQEDASKHRRSIEDIDQDAEIALVNESQGRMHDADILRVDDLEGNEVFVDVKEKIIEKVVSTADPVTIAGKVVTAASVEDSAAPTTATTADVDNELTLVKTLIPIKAAKPKVISTAITTPKAKVHSPSSEIPIEESISTPSNNPLHSGEDSIQLNELIIFYTNLQQQVLDFEEAKIAQAKEIVKLKKESRS